MGCMYLKECPAGKYIPVYLLVGGLFTHSEFYTKKAFRYQTQSRKRNYRNDENFKETFTTRHLFRATLRYLITLYQILLIVFNTGLMGILRPLLSISSTGTHSDPSEQTVLRQALMDNSSKSTSLINCFMICWFLIGTYWIYAIFEPKYGSECNKTLYLYAFWLVTTVYLTVALIVIIILCVFLIKLCVFCVEKLVSKPSESPSNVQLLAIQKCYTNFVIL